MQWATWSDWEEGTEIEAAVENDASVTATIAGGAVSWTVKTGTGDESTLDHYEVYASTDGVKAIDLGSVPAGTHQLDLSSACNLAKGTYHVFVEAVARPRFAITSPRPSITPGREARARRLGRAVRPRRSLAAVLAGGIRGG